MELASRPEQLEKAGKQLWDSIILFLIFGKLLLLFFILLTCCSADFIGDMKSQKVFDELKNAKLHIEQLELKVKNSAEFPISPLPINPAVTAKKGFHKVLHN